MDCNQRLGRDHSTGQGKVDTLYLPVHVKKRTESETGFPSPCGILQTLQASQLWAAVQLSVF